MGKRSRNRGAAGAGGTPARDRARPAPARGLKGLDPLRRTLAGYLVAALVLGVLTLVGIVTLGGTLGPFIVLAVVVLVAGLLHRAASRRLTGRTLGDEDRMVQTLAGGMLVMCVVLALAGAVLSVLA